MFKKLRLKFSAIVSVSTLLILVFLCLVLNLSTLNNLNGNIQSNFSKIRPLIEEFLKDNTEPSDKTDMFLNYFFVTIDDDNKIDKMYIKDKSPISKDDLTSFIDNSILKSNSTSGDYYSYKYELKDKLLIFIDAQAEKGAFSITLTTSLTVSCAVFVTVSISAWILSSIVIKPYEELYFKQKRFLTNASHELKTPLAIISANNEVLKLDNKDNQYLESSTTQINRMTKLIDEIITLNKLQEVLNENEFKEFNVVDDLLDATIPYKTILEKKNISLEVNTPDSLIMKADENSIMKLFSILMDNIYKYTTEDGKVIISLEDKKKYVEFKFSNSANEPKDKDLSKLFDRFYTLNKSRDRSSSGYGIGLSIAKVIVDNYKGSIEAKYSLEAKMFTFEIKIPKK
jgi:two-component system, OmpR family, sensor histidine kinase CiaH